jgi:hypothetical protein
MLTIKACGVVILKLIKEFRYIKNNIQTFKN